MGLRFLHQQFGACFFVTTSFKERRPHGVSPGVYETLADSTRFYLAKYEVLLPAYVFMPTHLHLLMMIDGNKLGSFMRDYKKYVAQKGFQLINTADVSVWQRGYDRQVIYSEKAFRVKMGYIHNNPVKSGLVGLSEEWFWSSVGAYLTDAVSPIPVWKEWLF